MASFATSPAADSVAIRADMLDSLTNYYPKESKNTSFYFILSAVADIATDVDDERADTITDVGVDEARSRALFPNFGYWFSLAKRGDFGWGWDDYTFMLKVLAEAWTLYGSTSWGMRRVVQVATGVSPTILEHYRYAGWLLGQFALGATVIVHTGDYIWNSVSRAAFSTISFWGIWPQQQLNVWTCGSDGANGQIWRSQNAGLSWTDMTPAHGVTIYKDIHGSGSYDTWAVGTTGALGHISHWNDLSGWSSTVIADAWILYGVWMATINDGWAVGSPAGGTPANIFSWDGVQWSADVSPTLDTLFAVHGVSSDLVYAVGANSAIFRWNGTLWSVAATPGVDIPVGIDFWGVHVVDANTIWVCGLNGRVAYTTDGGTSWSSFIMPPGDHLYGIWVSSDGQDVRIVGENGRFFYSSDGGATWGTETYQGTGADLYAIYMRPNETMGYMCGDTGSVLRRNGQSPGFTLGDGTYISNDDIVYGAILESRHGRRNSADIVVWNILDYALLWRFLNEMKPAHVKLFLMLEYPFVMDYYYYDQDFYGDVLGQHVLADVGSEEGIVVNGRLYGDSMSRVVYGEGELNIPQLT